MFNLLSFFNISYHLSKDTNMTSGRVVSTNSNHPTADFYPREISSERFLPKEDRPDCAIDEFGAIVLKIPGENRRVITTCR